MRHQDEVMLCSSNLQCFTRRRVMASLWQTQTVMQCRRVSLVLREECFSAGNAAAQLCVAFGMSNPYVVQQALHAFSFIFVPLTCNSPSALATCLLTFYNGCMQLQKLRDSKATISPQAVVRNLHRIVSACEPKAQSLDPAEASAQWVPECRR